jgi:hypothetical protein
MVDDPGIPAPSPGDSPPAFAIRLMLEFLVRDGTAQLTRPHVVLVTDEGAGVLGVLGPYPDALSAVLGAEAQRAEDLRELGPSDGRAYAVSPLLPPMPGSAED